MAIGIHWDDAFRLGFAPLDEQHERIFRIVADIDRHLAGAAPANAVVSALWSLREALADHFKYEETLMARVGGLLSDTAFDDHRACHEAILDDLDGILTSLGTESAAARLHSFGTILFRNVVLDDGEMVSALVRAGMLFPA